MAVKHLFRITLLCWLSALTLSVTGRAADVLLTLPFENVSGRPEYNWVGESFVVLYAELLDNTQMRVLNPDERNLVYEKLGLRASDLLTRAAVIRVAETAQANLALVGTYDIGGANDSISIAITARLIEVSSGRLVGNKVFTRSGLLSDLQAMQGELAWNVINERNRASGISKDQLINAAKLVPPRAYESFVKGIQTQDAKVREMLLRRAVQEAANGGNNHYAQALYELGMHFYRQRAFVDASEQLRQLSLEDPHYFESQFYLGMAAHQNGNLLEAAAAFERLAEALPLPEAMNNAGALWLLNGDQAKGLNWLRRAVTTSPTEASYRFNLGYALWKAGSFVEAAQQLKLAAEQNPRDGETLFLWAKALEASGNTAEAGKVDDQAKRNFPNYARWAVAPDKIPAPLRLKTEFNRAQFSKLEQKRDSASKAKAVSRSTAGNPVTIPASAPANTSQPASPSVSAPTASLDRARQLLDARNEPEAILELQRLLTVEATNAEGHFLLGTVLQRRNELDKAVSAYQSAVYWNPRHIGGHLALCRLFLARNDRALALTHARQALQIDPQNRDAVALKQQIETGR
ncbi:MAG: tetratricopeptide repeat protein [Acidobacteria bacterium]|nr:tetratricopeptide repeat protein [Acidobacteriota bacterium]